MSGIVLESIFVPLVQIVNKKDFNGGEVKLELSRSIKKSTSGFTGTCDAEMYLVDEHKDARTFYIHIQVTGNFKCKDSDVLLNEETLKYTVMHELVPHLSSVMASTMAISGTPAQLIPTHILSEIE